MFKFSPDEKSFQKAMESFDGQQKQVRFAAMQALNGAVFVSRDAVQREMKAVFDRPTKWVLGGVGYRKATRQKLSASVHLDFWGNKQTVSVDQVLHAEIHGGQRRFKRFEVALSRRGILPAGRFIAPGPGADIDASGNIKAGQIVQIMSWFAAFGEQGYKSNMTDKMKKRHQSGSERRGVRGFSYFALAKPHGKLKPGIYRRTDSSVIAIMFFVTQRGYRRRLDFYGVANRAAQTEYAIQFPIRLESALRTAK